MRKFARTVAVIAASFGLLTAGVSAQSAQAAPADKANIGFGSIAVGNTAAVWYPTNRASLQFRGIDREDCAGVVGGLDGLRAHYGNANGTLDLWEGTAHCDQQGSYVGIAPFHILSNGIVADVMPKCWSQLSCEFIKKSQVADRGAHIELTLPAQGTRQATHIDIYTQGITYAQIKTFVQSLKWIGY